MWRDSLKNNLTSIADLDIHRNADSETKKALESVVRRFPMSITPYYLSLIDWTDTEDPIRKMCVPSLAELDMTGSFDTSGEASNTKETGIQHKYPQTALILSTNVCGMYCRHCFRKRAVGISESEIARNFDAIADYVRIHREISNVLISGGDSFLLSNAQLEQYLLTYTAIPHLDFIRFGTRTPVTFPERINTDRELLTLLKTYNCKKQLFVVTQFNHPREITAQSTLAVKKILSCGIPVRNQTVLLRGVNDDSQTLSALLKGLTAIGVEPYYIFQCRPVSGVGTHFQVPLLKGAAIVAQAKASQNGIGKALRYVMSHPTGKIEILGPDQRGQMIFKYHQAKYPEDLSRMFCQRLSPEQTWLSEIPAGAPSCGSPADCGDRQP